MASSTGDQQPAEEPRSDQTEAQDPGTENVFIFGEVQWTSSLHTSAKPPTLDTGAPAQSESDSGSLISVRHDCASWRNSHTKVQNPDDVR